MEILIAIFIVACLAVIYYWIFDAKQKEKQELIKEQINGLIESHTNQLKSEGVNVDTVYTYQDNAFKQLDWSKAVAFRLIVDVANRQIVICNDLSNPFSPQKIPFEKIINCEVLSKNGWLSRKGISRAVVGGVIGGGAGAIIGASSAQKSIVEASNPVPTPLLGHRCRSSQEITGSPTPFSTSNHYLWICASASFSLSNPNIAA